MHTKTDEENQCLHKDRIMVVEDESITALNLQLSLEDMGFIVSSTAFTGEEALRKAARDRPDLILMDISLGGKMDGIETAGKIHSKYNIPVVYISANSDQKIMKRINETQPFGFISKPFFDAEIRCAVEIALDKHRGEKQFKESEAHLKEHKTRLLDVVNRQIEDLKQTNEALKQEIVKRMAAEVKAKRSAQHAAVGELTAGIIHEINNPINGIINYAQILSNQSEEGSQTSDIANRITLESTRIANIVKDLLSFMQENSTEDGPVHIDKVISNALSLTAQHLTQDQIHLTSMVPPDLPPVAGQPRLISQVFVNMIQNAGYALNQKYTGSHKHKVITIKADTVTIDEKQYIRTSFHDNGIGIPDNEMDKIMKPFFTTKAPGEGTGMGLSISNGIVQNSGGNISIYSVEDHCTDIVVDLPVMNNETGIPK